MPEMAEEALEWVGGCKAALSECPDEVQDVFGYALHLAQQGLRHPQAKVLKGIVKGSGAGILEVVENHDGDTYRAIYTVRFEGAVYALDVFQKKSKKGIATPKADLERIKLRYQAAKRHFEAASETRKK